MIGHMSEMPSTDTVPQWTLGWRLQRALAHVGMTADGMADELGVHRGTVSRWMNDRGAQPRAIYVRQWALRCGVSYEWLHDGSEDPRPGGPTVAAGGVGASGVLPRMDSNHQPAGNRLATVRDLRVAA